jgi:cytochrome c553
VTRGTVLFGWATLLAACGFAELTGAQSTQPDRSMTVTTRPSKSPAPVSFSPIGYFERNCARCHGDFGSAYGPTFGHGLSDEQLTKVCDDMAAGPGNAPVNADELKRLVDYHMAMIAGTPFVVVTRATETDADVTIEGEVSNNATVTVDGRDVKADGISWKAVVLKSGHISVTATTRASP